MTRAPRLAGLAAGVLLGALLLGHATGAAAQEREPLGSHQRHLRFELGVRQQLVEHAGLDPFAANDAVTQVTTGAAYTFLADHKLSLAGSLLYDYGGRSDSARSTPSSLSLHRFALGPEVRYHVLQVLAASLRVAPTLTRSHAELEDPTTGALGSTSWMFGVDATAGLAVELYGYASGDSRRPRLWLLAEGGYGWSAPSELALEPEDPGPATPNRLEPPNLGDLSVSGPLLRISAAISF